MKGDRNSVHVGSGWITDIVEFYGSCGGCAECARSSSSTFHSELPKKKEKFYRIFVASVKHVVYNDDEVKATEVQIFYEDKKSRKEKTMKSIYASSLNLGITRDDSMILECITHDESLVSELQVCLERMRSLLIKKNRTDRDYRDFYPEIPSVDRKNNLCIMVSHPHGQPKMITVGKRKEIYYSQPSNVEYRRQATIQTAIHYDTESCPGSSGAPVFMPTCIELRQTYDTRNVNSLVDAFVLRSHSIGNIGGKVNMSAGVMPLFPLPLPILALPSASEIKH
ncbi:hypothetical protein PoB_003811600 [Plakobranchus ocellatus]|uniref:Peptidase S1 domain-containing protein n=1 Tax=Plakobranchus ocellatus TaxID=259542 RepID=A0AAV4AYJ5_9GAST|nr:hypothetical protein PoB_003811600 [Plakobranchus ocellatus]